MTPSWGIHKDQRVAGYLAILLCAILWSTSGLFIKLVHWHPAQIAGARSLLAVLVLLALRFCSKSRNVSPGKLLPLFACGLCYAATMIFFVMANKLTTSANAILLQYTAPVWACLLAWFFLREKPRREQWAALVMVMTGMFLVLKSGLSKGSLGTPGSLLGDVFALVSGLAFAANSVVMRMKKDGNPADIMIAAHIITAVYSIPFFILYPLPLDSGNIISILFMGIFQIGAASALFAYGIKRVTAVQAMLTAAIEPVLNPVWVLLATGERPALPVIAGGCVIVAAVVFSAVAAPQRHKRRY